MCQDTRQPRGQGKQALRRLEEVDEQETNVRSGQSQYRVTKRQSFLQVLIPWQHSGKILPRSSKRKRTKL